MSTFWHASPRIGLVTFLAGFGVFMLLIVADEISLSYGLHESQRVFDDFCGGMIAGFLVYRYERVRMRQLSRQLHTIASMNHHVRNALQVIMYSAYVPSDKEQLVRIRESVERIEWALQEVLPGESPQDDDWPQNAKQPLERAPAA